MESILLTEHRDGAAWLTMNRPEVRNALATELVEALRVGIADAVADDAVRAIVLAGAGPVFCAGADINQYRDAFNREQVVVEGERLYDLLEEMRACPKPIIARVQRAAFGGAMGLVAAADLVVAESGTRFSLSEARLGLVPAVISKSMLLAVGPRTCRALMMLAEPFSPEDALRYGLIQHIAEAEELDATIANWLRMIQSNAPGALADAKALVGALANDEIADVRAHVTELAADRRADPEGQEGLGAFLEKRQPHWNAK